MILALISSLLLASEDPAVSVRGGYLVVAVALDSEDAQHAVFAEVAEEAAKYHGGRVVSFDGHDWSKWGQILQREQPDEVLVVVPPETFDIVLHRRVLLSSIHLDDDALPDFSFGYFTARDGDGLRGLWERTKAVHETGIHGKKWEKLAVTSGMKSAVYPGWISDTAKAAGFQGDSAFMAIVEDDPDHFDFIGDRLPFLEKASVIELLGNGDPEGIWLFSDQRNLDRSQHWQYEAERVGEDPKGEMPRLLGKRFASLTLQSPVVWSGTCHSAATERVFVEGDIVSTFGRTDEVTLYQMPPQRSLCLAIIDAGAVAYLAPIGANHGMSASRESEAAVVRGCTLGEAIKSTYDDVILAARGAPALVFPVPGEPHSRTEPVMQGGGCNRVLIGDPALRPFEATPHPAESVAIERVDDGIEVVVDWAEGWHPWAWDMFGTDRAADWRVVGRIPLGDVELPTGELDLAQVEVSAVGEGDTPMPYRARYASVESWRGERWLHLQASGPREQIERKAARVTFHIDL